MLNRKNIHTMTHSDPKFSELFDIDLKKALGLLTFLNVVSKILFWANLVPKLQSALFRMKIRTKRYSEVLIPNLTILLLSSAPKVPFLGKFGFTTLKCFF